MDEVPTGLKIRKFSRAHDPWFYLHAKNVTSRTLEPVIEAIPLEDYLFRYDRGAFWMGRYGFSYFLAPFDRFSRYLFDKYLHTRILYHALHASGLSKNCIVQDVAIPFDSCGEFVDWLEDNFGHYPLWLCPLSQRGKLSTSPSSLLFQKKNGCLSEVLMNFGVWGPGPVDRQKFLEINRKLERKVQDLGGQKWLYAHAYYKEDEFWTIFNRDEYESLRKKYHATHLYSVWQKVCTDSDGQVRDIPYKWLRCWPLRGFYGFFKAIMGGDYLLPKDE
jgi:hypothetical protein